MKLLVAATAIAAASLAHLALAMTQCKCESVDAVGEGNSSCSAAESNRKCTIDFNQFGQDAQQRAYSVIRQVEPMFSPHLSHRPVEASDVLTRDTRSAKELADTVVLYMAVAVTAQSGNRPSLSYDNGDLRALVALASDKKELFESVFRNESRLFGGRGVGTHSFNTRYTYSPGCMDIQLPRGLRVMFKTNWSRAAEMPRCEPS